MKRIVWIILGIVVLLLVAGGSFFGGTLYGKSQAQTAFAARRPGGFGARMTPVRICRVRTSAGGQGGMLFGQIEASVMVRSRSPITTASRPR